MPYCYRLSAWRLWLPVWIRRTIRARPVKLFIQRGQRGWSDEDLWGFDHHLGRVVAGGLRRLVETSSGYPQSERFPTPEDWRGFLLGIADDLDGWVSDPLAFSDDEAFERARAAMHRLADEYGSYWD